MQNGAFVISLDFELIWGVRDLAVHKAKHNLLITRKIVPELLRLFEKYQIHATWATVGFLFFDSRSHLLSALPKLKPNYANTQLSPYENIENEIGINEQNDPLHYAPTLIRQIIATPYQELGTHTFSHYYCLEDGQTPEDFDADLKAALEIAENYGCKIESIVFPRNQYNDAYLQICFNNGIKTFRGNEAVWFRAPSSRNEHRQWSRRLMRILDAYLNISGTNSYPFPKKGEPVNIPSSRYLRPNSNSLLFLEPLKLHRITTSMRQAAQAGHIFHLWWHPEDFINNPDQNLLFLEKILLEYKSLEAKYHMKSMTMGEVGKLTLP